VEATIECLQIWDLVTCVHSARASGRYSAPSGFRLHDTNGNGYMGSMNFEPWGKNYLETMGSSCYVAYSLWLTDVGLLVLDLIGLPPSGPVARFGIIKDRNKNSTTVSDRPHT
jgi:hypothetical protein